MTDVIENETALGGTPARETALTSLAAGIAAARPERLVRDRVRLVDDELRVTEVGDEAREGATDPTAHGRETPNGQPVRLDTDSGELVVSLSAYDEVILLGGGKAAAGVTRGLVETLGDRIDDGLIVVPESDDDGTGDDETDDDATPDDETDDDGTLDDETDDGGTPDDETADTDRTERIGPVTVARGGHPLPTPASVRATRRLLERARGADDGTLVVAPITGGGSATLAAPHGEATLEQAQSVTEQLLAAGASIAELNAVRRRLSAIKGGRLVTTAAPATVVGLLVSDVVGDRSLIASGPTVPDPTATADALAVCDRYGVGDDTLRASIRAGGTPPTDHLAFDRTASVVIGDGRTALRAARRAARARGYDARIVSAIVTGSARSCGRRGAALADSVADRLDTTVADGLDTTSPERDEPASQADGHTVETGAEEATTNSGVVLLTGGETTVTVTGDGRGGPNCEYALAGGVELADRGVGSRIAVGAVDTDGRDGSTDVAGGLVDGTSVDPPVAHKALQRNDAATMLDAHDAVIRTGPTGTNVDDLRVLVVQRD